MEILCYIENEMIIKKENLFMVNQSEIVTFLEELLNIPSPTGYTDKAMAFVKKEFEKLGLKTSFSKKRSMLATLEGEDDINALLFSGHVDTLGVMIKEIKSNGRLGITTLGSYAPVTIEGNYVTVETNDEKKYRGTIVFDHQSVHTYRDVNTAEREIDRMEVRLDEEVNSYDDVLALGISVGDFCFLDPNVEINPNGFIKSRHLDDKSGVAAMYGIAKYFYEHKIKPKRTLHFYFSNYEEVGHGSSAFIPENTTEFISIDMAAMGDQQSSKEDKVSICVKDISGPYDYLIRKKMIALCQKHNIDYVIDVYRFYSSDASAMQRAGHDIPAIVIGPGVESSHAYERTHYKGIEETIKLGVYYAQDHN